MRVTLEPADGGSASLWGGCRSVAGFELSVEVETQEAVLVAGNRRTVSEEPELVAPSAVLDFRDRFVDAYHSELDAFVAVARGVGPNRCDLQEAVRRDVLVAAARTALLERRVISLSPQWTGQAGVTE